MSEEPVVMLAQGFLYVSVCAKEHVSVQEIERYVNDVYPAGTTYGWRVSDNETFGSGQTNPCKCEKDSSRIHYLLEC